MIPKDLRYSSKTKRKSRLKHKLTPDAIINGEEIYLCHYCGKTLSLLLVTVDHKVALGIGGDHSVSNLVASCKECNLRKGTKSYREFKKLNNGI